MRKRPALLVALALPLALALACGPKPKPGSTTAGDSTAEADDAARIAEILAASKLPARLPEPIAGDPLGVTVHRLANGLTVYISPDHESPRIEAWIAVRAGSRHDPAASTGLAHYLEHMLFKGTSRFGTIDFAAEKVHLDRIATLYDDLRAAGDDAARAAILADIDAETQKAAAYAIPNEIDTLYAALGITGVNAFTSYEQTVYIANLPSNRFEAWATIEGERFADPQFRLFYPELEIVYEEKNRTLDSPIGRVFEALGAAMFPTHPYGTQPTIGHIDHLKTPAYADMVDYYERWYVPNNMAVVLAGDVDADTALPALEKAFGKLRPRPLEAPAEAAIAPPQGRVEREIVAPGEQAVYLSWLTASSASEDRLALEVMDLLVDNATTGLVNVDLLLSQKLPDAGSYASFMNEAGVWTLTGTAREGQSLEEVEALLLGVVARLRAGEFSQEELDAIVVNQEIADKRKIESHGARVSLMTDAFVEHRPWPEVAGEIERLRAVTRDDVIRVANQYLGDDLVVVKRIAGEFSPPRIDKPVITPIALDTTRKSELRREVEAMPVDEIEPRWLVEGRDYERAVTSAGPVVAAPNRRSDLFALRYRFALGQRREPLLCHALDLLSRSGTRKLDAEALRRKLYAMGTSVDFSCGDDETVISIEGLDRNLEASVREVEAWLTGARLEPEALAKLTANTISQRSDATKEPSVLARALADKALRGEQSSFLAAVSNRALRRARVPALARLLARLPSRAHRTEYFGPRPAAEVASVTTIGTKHRPVRPVEPRVLRHAGEPTIYFLDRSVSQSQVRLAFPAGTVDEKNELVADVFSSYLGGGMGSLVFQEIREARGLAYSAWATHWSAERRGDEVGVLAAMGTQVDKTVEALEAMLGLLRGMKIDPVRFSTAVRAVEEELRTGRVAPRSVAAQVSHWDELGHAGDPRPEKLASLPSVDPAALEAFAASQTGAPPVIAILGDASRIDLAKLGEMAKIVKLKAGELFSY